MPAVEQGAEQPLEDHRVGDVVDLELVEAEQRRLGREVGGDLGDRLAGAGAALLLDAGVHVEHEGVEMHPPLVRDRRGGEKQIHQHRLAAADRAPEIDARAALPAPGSPRPSRASQPRRSRRPVIPTSASCSMLQPGDGAKLRRVGADQPGLRALPIERRRPERRRDPARRVCGKAVPEAGRSTGIKPRGRGHKKRGPPVVSPGRPRPPIYSALRQSAMAGAIPPARQSAPPVARRGAGAADKGEAQQPQRRRPRPAPDRPGRHRSTGRRAPA